MARPTPTAVTAPPVRDEDSPWRRSPVPPPPGRRDAGRSPASLRSASRRAAPSGRPPRPRPVAGPAAVPSPRRPRPVAGTRPPGLVLFVWVAHRRSLEGVSILLVVWHAHRTDEMRAAPGAPWGEAS